jgi:hypothetical protein
VQQVRLRLVAPQPGFLTRGLHGSAAIDPGVAQQSSPPRALRSTLVIVLVATLSVYAREGRTRIPSFSVAGGRRRTLSSSSPPGAFGLVAWRDGGSDPLENDLGRGSALREQAHFLARDSMVTRDRRQIQDSVETCPGSCEARPGRLAGIRVGLKSASSATSLAPATKRGTSAGPFGRMWAGTDSGKVCGRVRSTDHHRAARVQIRPRDGFPSRLRRR